MIAVTVVLLLTGLLAIGFIKSSNSSNSSITPEQIDLDSVRDALMEKRGWSLERANSARAEYLRFLTLLQMKPGFMLVPWPTPEGNDDLDQFWHQHILDTAKYASDCDRLFGRMIHHNPHIVRGSGHEQDAIDKTHRLYQRTFASGVYGRPADAAFIASCGACATADSHSSGHGSHGSGHGGHGSGDGSHGGSHSCGGHSCGGHGCGGHGCGGGH